MMKRTLITLLAATSVLTFTLPYFAARADRVNPDMGGPGGERLEQLAEDLNLTAAQQEQIRAVREETRTQMQNVLTAEQQAQLESARQNGEPPHQAMRNLNLTAAQKEEMRTIHENSRTQMDAILTPEQQEQLQEMRENRREANGGLRR